MDNNLLLVLFLLVLLVANLIVSGITLSKINKSKDLYINKKPNSNDMYLKRQQELLKNIKNINSSTGIIYRPDNDLSR